MRVTLYKRHYGVHSYVKKCYVKGKYTDYLEKLPSKPHDAADNFKVNEELLIQRLPKRFLLVEPSEVLLDVRTDKNGGSGQRGLTHFRNWCKYFDSYSIELKAY